MVLEEFHITKVKVIPSGCWDISTKVADQQTYQHCCPLSHNSPAWLKVKHCSILTFATMQKNMFPREDPLLHPPAQITKSNQQTPPLSYSLKIQNDSHRVAPDSTLLPSPVTDADRKRVKQRVKLLGEREGELGISFPWDLAHSHRRDGISLHSPSFRKCLHGAIIGEQHQASMHRHYISVSSLAFPDTKHIHILHWYLQVLPHYSKKKKKTYPPGQIISWQGVLLCVCVCVWVCVCTCSPVPLSPAKTNEQINTWLTQVPCGEKWRRGCLPTNFTQLGRPPPLQQTVRLQEFVRNLLSFPIVAMGLYCW